MAENACDVDFVIWDCFAMFWFCQIATAERYDKYNYNKKGERWLSFKNAYFMDNGHTMYAMNLKISYLK